MKVENKEVGQGGEGTVPSDVDEMETNSTLGAEPSGVELIAVERARQALEEGWTDDHDDAHYDQQLAQAAACYAWPAPRPLLVKRAWPWTREWWKPTIYGVGAEWDEVTEARMRDLVKAGALIAAEIDRLQRLLAGRANKST